MITVETKINAPVEKVWDYWSSPQHITNWTFASDDWHSPYADNDLQKGGKFKTTMAAKDGSFSFDFEGIYTHIELHKTIEYVLGDGRKVKITFENIHGETIVRESFDPENENPEEMQKGGWQAILNNFKKYTEQ